MEERPSAWHIGGFDDKKLEETLALIDAYTKKINGGIKWADLHFAVVTL